MEPVGGTFIVFATFCPVKSKVSEHQRNVKNVTLRNTELYNTKKTIYFTTPKITFIKHRKKNGFFALLRTGPFLRFRRAKQGAVCVG